MRLVQLPPTVWVPMRLVPLAACLGVAVNRQGPCIYMPTRHPQLARSRSGEEVQSTSHVSSLSGVG
jgi:hypothetical protein